MSYKTGKFKMFKGSLKHFKKHNPITWRNRWLFDLKVGDFVSGCDGFNHKISDINIVSKLFVGRNGPKYIRELSIKFEDGFSCSANHCLEKKNTNDQIKESLIFACKYFLEYEPEESDKRFFYELKLNNLVSGEIFWDENGCKKEFDYSHGYSMGYNDELITYPLFHTYKEFDQFNKDYEEGCNNC